MRKFECFEYCEFDSSKYYRDKILFGYSKPADDYFNDNLDHYFDEDDYYDYEDHPEQKFDLEDNEYTHSHKSAH